MCMICLKMIFDGILVWDSFFYFIVDDQWVMFVVFVEYVVVGVVLMFLFGLVKGEVIGEFGGDLFYYVSFDLEEYLDLFYIYGFDGVFDCDFCELFGWCFIWIVVKQD